MSYTHVHTYTLTHTYTHIHTHTQLAVSCTHPPPPPTPTPTHIQLEAQRDTRSQGTHRMTQLPRSHQRRLRVPHLKLNTADSVFLDAGRLTKNRSLGHTLSRNLIVCVSVCLFVCVDHIFTNCVFVDVKTSVKDGVPVKPPRQTKDDSAFVRIISLLINRTVILDSNHYLTAQLQRPSHSKWKPHRTSIPLVLENGSSPCMSHHPMWVWPLVT